MAILFFDDKICEKRRPENTDRWTDAISGCNTVDNTLARLAGGLKETSDFLA